MSPKKILFVDHAQSVGGAENSLHSLITHLAHNKWEPHLATANGRFSRLAQESQILTHIIEFPRLRRSVSIVNDWRTTAQQIAQLATSIEAELLHANTIRAALYTMLAAKMARLPFIWHMRDFWLSENKPNQLWLDSFGKRVLISSATKVIANSKATAAHLPKSSKIHVVHNGIALAKFDPTLDTSSFRTHFQIPQDASVVGMVGRLRPWKGQTTFLQIAAHIATHNPNVCFLIVGGATFGVDQTYQTQLKTQAQELNLTERVIFTEQINNIPEALATMNIFVHPGDPEPFGLVNIEAMAMAKPIVAFNHGALPEIVQNGKTGLLVEPYDAKATATAIISLLDKPQEQISLGKNGRKIVEITFTVQRTAQQISKIYEHILNQK